MRIREDNTEIFNILLKNKMIDDNLATKLKNAKGMKNIILHQYVKINDDIVFKSISEELEKNVREFINNVENIGNEIKNKKRA